MFKHWTVCTWINYAVDVSLSTLLLGLAANEDFGIVFNSDHFPKYNFPKLRSLLLREERLKQNTTLLELPKADIACHTATPNITKWQKAIVRAIFTVFLPILFVIKAYLALTGNNPSHDCLMICSWEPMMCNDYKKGVQFSVLAKHTKKEYLYSRNWNK